MPDWYKLFLVADRMRCFPWEFLDEPERSTNRELWLMLGFALRNAEIRAQNHKIMFEKSWDKPRGIA
jgi:hypothetical protein